MTWRIRAAGDGDAARLALVGAATFLETFAGVLDVNAIVPHCRHEHGEEAYRRLLHDGYRGWIGEADTGGAPIGYALLGPTTLPGSRSGDLELKRIYVLSRFHGSGLGAALLSRAVEHAAEQGAHRVLLGVYAGNARAIAFYRKNGFEQIADRRFQVGERAYDDAVLARPLP